MHIALQSPTTWAAVAASLTQRVARPDPSPRAQTGRPAIVDQSFRRASDGSTRSARYAGAQAASTATASAAALRRPVCSSAMWPVISIACRIRPGWTERAGSCSGHSWTEAMSTSAPCSNPVRAWVTRTTASNSRLHRGMESCRLGPHWMPPFWPEVLVHHLRHDPGPPLGARAPSRNFTFYSALSCRRAFPFRLMSSPLRCRATRRMREASLSSNRPEGRFRLNPYTISAEPLHLCQVAATRLAGS